MKFSHSYVCEPNNISIIAESTPAHSKGIKIVFYLSGKEAFSTTQQLPTFTPEKDDIDAVVSSYCNLIKSCTKNFIQSRFPTNKITKIIVINQSLTKVRTKIGKTIWREKANYI